MSALTFQPANCAACGREMTWAPSGHDGDRPCCSMDCAKVLARRDEGVRGAHYRECATVGCRTPATMRAIGCSAEFRGKTREVDYCAECAEMASQSDLVERVERIESDECPGCLGDGEVGVFPFAWCRMCRGTGLADNECAGCGHATALDTLDRVPLDCIGVVVHATCDTGHHFFDRRPEPVVWGTL